RLQKTNEMRKYRLDRIRNIKVSEESFVPKPFHLQEYVDHSFHMFAGEDIWIKIRFHNDLVNVVLDRFGHEADIQKADDDSFMLTTKAKLSDWLVNCVLTCGAKERWLSHDYVVDKVKNKVQQMVDLYR